MALVLAVRPGLQKVPLLSLRGEYVSIRRGNLDIISNMKQPCIYIVASKRNGTLYTGVTSDLVKRIYSHRNGLINGFTKKYNCKILVFYELHETMESAIFREKQIKAGSRKKKLELVESLNLGWNDLYEEII